MVLILVLTITLYSKCAMSVIESVNIISSPFAIVYSQVESLHSMHQTLSKAVIHCGIAVYSQYISESPKQDFLVSAEYEPSVTRNHRIFGQN